MTGAALTLTIALASTALGQREHPISSEIRVPAGMTVRPGEKFAITLAVTIPTVPTVWHLYSIT
ncbi:MAG: hypothetical protein ABIR92_10000, partial [Gemmatimonadaceae bacterium]